MLDEVLFAAERGAQLALDRFPNPGPFAFVSNSVEDKRDIRAPGRNEGEFPTEIRARVLVDGDVPDVAQRKARLP